VFTFTLEATGRKDSAMKLVKRYFDLIDDVGDYLIGYDAAAQLGSAPLRYEALLSSIETFNRTRVSIENEGSVENFPQSLRFGGSAQWAVEQGPAPRLLAVQVGKISWRVHAIGANVRISCGGAILSGGGYSETVTLCEPPWRLGLKQVRWGRFVGARSWAVWNIVSGAASFAFAALDGTVCGCPKVEADRIGFSSGGVELGARVRRVHEGDVLTTQLPQLAPLVRALAGKRFQIFQSKHVREARLTSATGDTEEGYAMDESVRFSLGG
jgi:hypothetical protein